MSVTRIRVSVVSLDTMCAQEYTLLIVGGCERKRGRGRKKKRERKNVKTAGVGRKETASTRKYKEPDRARNIFSFLYFSHRECAIFSEKILIHILPFTN